MHAAPWICTNIFFAMLRYLLGNQNDNGLRYYNILDVGSADVNGNMKTAIEASEFSDLNYSYTGLDMSDDFNVDLVVSPDQLASAWPIALNSVDIIISSSCFEHDDAFWDTFAHMAKLLKNDGLMFITVPSTGKMHRFPVDNWRFFPDAAHALAKYANRVNSIPGNPEYNAAHAITVLFSEVVYGVNVWKDLYMIFRKGSPGVDNSLVSAELSRYFRPFGDIALYNIYHYFVFCVRYGERYPSVNELLVKEYNESVAAQGAGQLYRLSEWVYADINRRYCTADRYCRFPFSPYIPSDYRREKHVLMQLVLTVDQCSHNISLVLREQELTDGHYLNGTINLLLQTFSYPVEVGYYLREEVGKYAPGLLEQLRRMPAEALGYEEPFTHYLNVHTPYES